MMIGAGAVVLAVLLLGASTMVGTQRTEDEVLTMEMRGDPDARSARQQLDLQQSRRVIFRVCLPITVAAFLAAAAVELL